MHVTTRRAQRIVLGGEPIIMGADRDVLRFNKRELNTLRKAGKICAEARELLRDHFGRDENGHALPDYEWNDLDLLLAEGEHALGYLKSEMEID